MNKVILGLGTVAAALGIYLMVKPRANAISNVTNIPSPDTAQLTPTSQNPSDINTQVEAKVNYAKAPEIYRGFTLRRYLRFSVEFTLTNKNRKGQSVEINNITLTHGKTPITRILTALKGYVQPNSTLQLGPVEFDVSLSDLETAKVADFGLSDSPDAFKIAEKLQIQAKLQANMSEAMLTLDLSKIALQGLGLVSKTKRKIRPMKEYAHLINGIGSLENTNPLLTSNGGIDETLSHMAEIIKKYKGDTKKLAQKLKANDLKTTLKNIFDFVYTYIEYVPDKQFIEQLRRPLRTLHEQKGDCDCYSILIASILENLNIPYWLRVTAYSDPDRFQHVYVIVPISKGKHITIDPVLDNFNEEKQYSRKKDYKV